MKIHLLFFYLLILLLPTQLGKHFWPDWSMVNGLRIDYLSPTIYLTDLLILGILGSWGMEKILKLQAPSFNMAFKKYGWVLFGAIFLLFNCFLAKNQPAAFYKLIKLGEFGLLGIYIAKTRFSLNIFSLLLSVSVVYSSFMAIFQFLNQASLSGVLWFLGERAFNAGTPGIAQTVFNGQLILRPYATFPHPNVLAGFLVIVLPLVLWTKPRFWWFSFALGTLAIFLTMSRSAWFVFGLELLAMSFYKKRWAMGVIGAIGVIVSILGILIFSQPESFILRQDLNLAALKILMSSPLWGVGLNNFLVLLPNFYQPQGFIRFFQPAHNIYFLVLAEIGAIGLIGVMWFLILTYRRLLNCSIVSLLIALSAILALGLFDHYFYTLQQGQIIFTLILGLAWSGFPRSVKMEG